MNLNVCRKWIAEGKLKQAQTWLMEQPETTPEHLLLHAMCQRAGQLYHWERAIAALASSPATEDLLLAHRMAAKWSRVGCDQKRQLLHLDQAIKIAQELEHSEQRINLQAIRGNLLLKNGHLSDAEEQLSICVQSAIQQRYHLIVIAEGIILCGLWMRQGQFERTTALCINIEAASIARSNWIALATARMMRASCWLILKSPQQAISLLFETGNFLHQRGAVAALNLIKARLGEIQLLLGEETFEQLRQTSER